MSAPILYGSPRAQKGLIPKTIGNNGRTTTLGYTQRSSVNRYVIPPPPPPPSIDDAFATVVYLINATGTVNGISSDYASDIKGNPVSANDGVQSEPHDGITKFQDFAMEGNGGVYTISSTNSVSGGTLGSGEYTVECWCYPLENGNFELLSTRASTTGDNTSGIGLMMVVDTHELRISTGNTGQLATVGTPLQIGQWNHVAVTRDGSNTTRIFVNGVKGKEFLDTRNYQDQIIYLFDARQQSAYFGYGGARWKGYIEDFRITKGVARYTSNFAVPTQAFPTS